MTATTTVVSQRSLAEEVDAFYALDYSIVADPYPLYRRLREEQPVFRHRDKVLVSSYEDCKTIQTSPLVHQGISVRGTRYRNAAATHAEQERIRMGEMFGFFEQRVGGANGAHHLRLRRLATKAFTPKVVAQMHAEVTSIAEGLVRDLPTDEPIEFVEAYAYHLPLIVISNMLHIPPEGRADLRRWADSLGKFVGADWRDAGIIEEAHEAMFNLRRYLTEVFDSRRDGETTDLLAALINAEDGGDTFTEEELVAMITQFIFAGHETSTMFLGNALVHLLGEYREDWEAIGSDPSLVPAATEEMLRFASPTHNIDKLAAGDFEIGGVQVHEGDTINVMIASSNHDESVFPGADRFELHRGANNHMTFGRGPHHCLGASLARMEAQVSIGLLSSRFPQMRIATDEIRWRPTHMNRGPQTLPVVLGPRSSSGA